MYTLGGHISIFPPEMTKYDRFEAVDNGIINACVLTKYKWRVIAGYQINTFTEIIPCILPITIENTSGIEIALRGPFPLLIDPYIWQCLSCGMWNFRFGRGILPKKPTEMSGKALHWFIWYQNVHKFTEFQEMYGLLWVWPLLKVLCSSKWSKITPYP